MVLFALASILAASPPTMVVSSAEHRAPTVRAAGHASVRLISAAVIKWDQLEVDGLPSARSTTITSNGRTIAAKIVEFQ